MSDAASSNVSTVALKDWASTLRPTHWIKNLLLAAPVVFAHAQPSLAMVGLLVFGMTAMSAVASAGYLVNDLLDRDADSRHSSKRQRPIASGRIGQRQAMFAAVSLVASALLTSGFVLGLQVSLLLAGYFLASLAYSVMFKRLAYIDVVVLAWLYIWRFVIGGAITGIAISGWLFAFGYGLFVSLALMKRLDELVASNATNPASVIAGRAYRKGQSPQVLIFSVLLASLSVGMLAAYVGFSAVASAYYLDHGWLWVATILLALWLGHILRRAAAGRLGGDPMLFAASDPLSLGLAVAVTAALIAAL